jgi:hypothetical protein
VPAPLMHPKDALTAEDEGSSAEARCAKGGTAESSVCAATKMGEDSVDAEDGAVRFASSTRELNQTFKREPEVSKGKASQACAVVAMKMMMMSVVRNV